MLRSCINNQTLTARASAFINKRYNQVVWIICDPEDNHLAIIYICFDCATSIWWEVFILTWQIWALCKTFSSGYFPALWLKSFTLFTLWWQIGGITAVNNHLSSCKQHCVFLPFPVSPSLHLSLLLPFRPEPVLCHRLTLSSLWVFLMPVMHIYVILSKSAPATMAQERVNHSVTWSQLAPETLLGRLKHWELSPAQKSLDSAWYWWNDYKIWDKSCSVLYPTPPVRRGGWLAQHEILITKKSAIWLLIQLHYCVYFQQQESNSLKEIKALTWMKPWW